MLLMPKFAKLGSKVLATIPSPLIVTPFGKAEKLKVVSFSQKSVGTFPVSIGLSGQFCTIQLEVAEGLSPQAFPPTATTVISTSSP